MAIHRLATEFRRRYTSRISLAEKSGSFGAETVFTSSPSVASRSREFMSFMVVLLSPIASLTFIIDEKFPDHGFVR
jgi:hypothetical protein